MKALSMKILRMTAVLVAFALPAQADVNIQEVTSPGGIKAWLIEDHNIPFVALEISFRGGASLDVPGKRGAVNMMASLLNEGAGELDSQAFAEAGDALATRINIDTMPDRVQISTRFLTESREESVELLRSALNEPRFDPDAIERLRVQMLARWQADEKDLFVRAENALQKLAYGDHPYGSSEIGTQDSIKALTRDDILAAYKGVLAQDRVLVSVAGDLSAADLGPLLDKLFSDLPETGLPQPDPVLVKATGGITVVDFPAPLSAVFFFQQGVAFSDDDYAAASILNEIMGGERFSTRLMLEIREKRGLSYGVGSALRNNDKADLLVGQFASSNDATAKAIDVVRNEWIKIASDGISAEELEAAKIFMTGNFPLLFDGNQTTAYLLAQMQMLDMPPSYPQNRAAILNAVTLDDIKRVAKRVFRPDTLHFVVIGQPEGVSSTD